MAVILSRRRDAGDMFQRSAARRRRDRAALPPELAGALRGVVRYGARPSVRSDLYALVG